jgi:hypothetical protein
MKSNKRVGIKVFLTICLMIEGSGSGSVPRTNGSGSGRPKKHLDPTGLNPDPQHCNIKTSKLPLVGGWKCNCALNFGASLHKPDTP